VEREKIMARFVRLRAELFNGVTYWGGAEYYEAGPGHIHVTEYQRGWVDYIAPGAETSLQGVFLRESGDHGEIWFPCPERTEFVCEGALLASVHRYGSNWDVHIQPTLGLFFTAAGSVFPLSRDAVMTALSHKIRIRPYGSLEAAVEVVKAHAEVYDSSDRVIP
jgi:hypothetical protein